MKPLKSLFSTAVVLAVFMFGLSASAQKSKQILIKFKPDVTVEQIDSLTKTLGLKKVRTMRGINVDVFEVDEQSVSQVVAVTNEASFVEYAEPSMEVTAFATTAAVAQEGSGAVAIMVAHKGQELLIKYKQGVQMATARQSLANANINILSEGNAIGILRCSVAESQDLSEAIAACNADPNVEYAEPNYIYYASVIPNDTRYNQLWAPEKIQATLAWDTQTGSRDIIVGVIDTGVDFNHGDLQANIWKNPGETGGGKESNGVDDDGNGFVDDHVGWDFINDDNHPMDDNRHGTHVSGTIGAEGNNQLGVVGVCWQVRIMPLKFLGGDGSGSTADAVNAIIYGTDNGAKVLSNSWGGGGRSQALEDAIEYANDRGVLFVAAAGNDSRNNDSFPSYPASYIVPNVISVASSTSSEALSGFSNYGRNSVHLAAPGSNIWSTTPGHSYEALNGTSMATPHVSGAAALVWSQFPSITMSEVKTRILGGVDRSGAYTNTTTTGGRLNVFNAISSNPVIATQRLKNTLDTTGPYVVEADIVDDGGIGEAKLTYQVGASPVEVAMTSVGNSRYRGQIPGQALGTTIVYFVTAMDNLGNSSKDSNLNFTIAQPTDPGGPGGGCCGGSAVQMSFDSKPVDRAVNTVLNIAFFAVPLIILRKSIRRKN